MLYQVCWWLLAGSFLVLNSRLQMHACESMFYFRCPGGNKAVFHVTTNLTSPVYPPESHLNVAPWVPLCNPSAISQISESKFQAEIPLPNDFPQTQGVFLLRHAWRDQVHMLVPFSALVWCQLHAVEYVRTHLTCDLLVPPGAMCFE